MAAGVDVTDEASVVELFERATSLLGRIDALVTSAGIVDMTPFFELDAATFRRVHDVNVVGTFLFDPRSREAHAARRADLHDREHRRQARRRPFR